MTAGPGSFEEYARLQKEQGSVKDDGVQVQVQGDALSWRRRVGKGGEVEGDTEVEDDIFSRRSVGPWQFCHACFSQDLCSAVSPFKRRLLPSTVIIAPTPGAVPRRSTSYRPITVWPFRQRDAAQEIPKASPTKATTQRPHAIPRPAGASRRGIPARRTLRHNELTL